MLRLELSPSVERFRSEFRLWLGDHQPPPHPESSDFERFIEVGRRWQETLAADRWIGVHWPERYGGRGLSLVEEAVIQEELVRAGAPQILGLFGVTMVGPVLIAHGTEEQRSRYLQPILRGEEIWCQGFSEPGAGSDLAAISTRANLEEGRYHLYGQKIWTSFAQVADHCFVLCRTEPGSVRHRGLSYLLVSMKQSGVTTRPLQQISGDREFNEVFFDGAVADEGSIVGVPGEGWKIAIATLMYERVVLTFARQLQSEVALRKLLKRWATSADESSPSGSHTAELARQVAKACAVRSLSYGHLLRYVGGAAPGPEGSLDKLLWSESFQEIAKLALQMEPLAGAFDESREEMHRYLYSRGRTIAAGSSEIQRSIIAERLLDLPRSR